MKEFDPRNIILIPTTILEHMESECTMNMHLSNISMWDSRIMSSVYQCLWQRPVGPSPMKLLTYQQPFDVWIVLRLCERRFLDVTKPKDYLCLLQRPHSIVTLPTQWEKSRHVCSWKMGPLRLRVFLSITALHLGAKTRILLGGC